MSVKVTNNAYGVLAGGISAGALSFTLSGGAGSTFPAASVASGHWFWATIFNPSNVIEVVKVTDRTGDVFTITRAQDGTSASAFITGDSVELRPTAAIHNDLLAAIAAVDTATQIHGAAAVAITDSDELGYTDAEDSFLLKKVTWANIKATFYAALGALIAGGTAKTVPVGGDSIAISDSAASGATKTLTFTALWAMAITWAGKITFTGTMKVQQALEKITITAAAPAATQNFDWLTQAIQYFTTAGANNWTLNVRGDSGTTLDSLMAVGESITLTVMATMTGTPYYASALNIDGSAVTPKWVGGTAPSSGDASCINLYTYTIVKTAAATFTVIASKGKTS